MSEHQPKLSRRAFLAVAGVGGAATVAAVAYKALPSDAATRKSTNKRGGTRYQVTEHIQNYYRTASV